jgi:starch synthase (maltosyl-transferring)
VPQGARIYNLFPTLAGSVSAWKKHLDRIAGMGFNWIFLNPFHAPGSSGSLYAVKDYYALNPLLVDSTKDRADQTIRMFIKAAEEKGIAVMMDLVVNHTAKDSPLAERHPDWYERESDGTLRSPFAIEPDSGKKTVWGDLAELNYRDRPERAEIVAYFCDVVRHYVGLGIRGFRCDAAYKVPKDVWRALIAAGRRQHDDLLFVAENLGAMEEEVLALRGAGFDYLFNSSKYWDFRQGWLLKQYEMFRSIAPSISFPESHDTDRLVNELGVGATIPPVATIQRRYKAAYLFAAVFATGVMIPIGYEYGFRKRLHVVKTRPEDWEQPTFDLTRYIGEVNRMKASLPVLNDEGPQRATPLGDGRVVCLLRRALQGPGWTLTVVNSDSEEAVSTRLEQLDQDVGGGREVSPGRQGAPFKVGDEIVLQPSEVRVYANR